VIVGGTVTGLASGERHFAFTRLSYGAPLPSFGNNGVRGRTRRRRASLGERRSLFHRRCRCATCREAPGTCSRRVTRPAPARPMEASAPVAPS
jgi:hypothetical protein